MNKNFDHIIQNIQKSKKYHKVMLPEDTLFDLIKHEAAIHQDEKDLEDAVRVKLHNIIAPYLDTTDYAKELVNIETVLKSPDPEVRLTYCRHILNQHASTRERQPYVEDFYRSLFQKTGTPTSILDLACGLNPFAIPFMKLPTQFSYHAYDIHKPRIDLINRFFTLITVNSSAHHQDILVNPPEIMADAAFFFKEAHRLEKREPGANKSFWRNINSKLLIVSLPVSDLKHHHNLTAKHRKLVENAVSGSTWNVEELIIRDELVFIIKKQ